MAWHVYILRCADGSLYTGSTNDPERRLREHNGTAYGAKYTRARRPVELTYLADFPGRSEALKEEARIKGLTRTGKLRLVEAAPIVKARTKPNQTAA